MSFGPYRVLTDLSFASLSYCGIAQESRLLLKTLWELDSVDPTGLIFSRLSTALGLRDNPSEELDKDIEDQALFMQSIVQGFLYYGWRRRSYLLKCFFRQLLSRPVRTRRLDNGLFWDAVWRNLLSRTLSDEDIKIAQECPYLLTDFGLDIRKRPTLHINRSIKLDTRGFDFALFHNATPVTVSPGTQKLVRYYDLIPGLRPDLVSCRDAVMNHFRDIRLSRDDSTFVCISPSAQNDLVSAFPELENRSYTIPVVLSDAYYPDLQPNRLPQILAARVSERAAKLPKLMIRKIVATRKMRPYIIMASTLEPRKNYVYLIREFERLIGRNKTNLNLIIVGNLGWKYEETIAAMKPLIQRGRLFHLESVATEEMRILYSHAKALVFPSLYEGFGYTPLEAMRCHTPVIASDIAAHRWVYGDAALYCNPYEANSLSSQLEQLLFPENHELRADLIERGKLCVEKYSPYAVGQQWLELFEKLKPRKLGLDKPTEDIPYGFSDAA